jgi:hypothetical protein
MAGYAIGGGITVHATTSIIRPLEGIVYNNTPSAHL